MSSQDRILGPLLELGDLKTRRTRTEHVERALRTALLLTEADASVLLLPGARRGERLVLHAGSAAPAVVPSQNGGSEVVRLFTEEAKLLVLPDLVEQPACAAGDACPGVIAGPVLFAPVRMRDPSPGYLAAYRKCGRARFSQHENRTMVLLSDWFGLALETLRLSSGKAKLAVTDELTEVYNARFLRTALRRELRRAGRFGQELSLVLLEVDQIEALQAENGEMRANAVLKELATLLARDVRAFDLVARVEGDGFMLILPQTGKKGAKDVAERMRSAIERNEFSIGPAGSITASFGVATFPREGGDEKALVASVERALTRARQRGPNCIYAFERAA